MRTMPVIRIDRTKTLAEEPDTGHNRWHPDIPLMIRCEPGEEVILETRDAFDGQFGPDASLDAVAAPNLDRLHPLTGPVYIEEAEQGDLLDIEILDIEPDRYGYVRGSRSGRARPPRRGSASPGSLGRTTICRPNSPHLAGSTPLPVSQLPGTASTTPRMFRLPPATRSST
jgi:hypothetical protein